MYMFGGNFKFYKRKRIPTRKSGGLNTRGSVQGVPGTGYIFMYVQF